MSIPLQKPEVESVVEPIDIPEEISGKIGLGSWATQVEYDDVKVTSNGETLFADDFSEDSSDVWSTNSETWVIEDGVYKQTSNDTDIRAVAGDVDWSNYTLELRARKTGGDEGMLILFGVQDSENYYWLNLGGWGNTQHAIEKSASGAKSTIGEQVSGTIELDRWYDIKVEVSGMVIKTYLDGELIHEVDDTLIPSPTLEYHANDASVGDLDGDGQYEIILKWEPNNAKDNSHSGFTDEVFLDAYKLDGTLLWRIGLGKNIRAGAHYTQFLVYDFNGDGKAEVAMKTADGTVDGTGAVIGDANADYRNEGGYILEGPEYLSIFDGETGKELDRVDYYPPRGDVCDWGDCYGNRVDRFLAGVAYLDGERPSMIMARGYYTRTVLAAYDFRDGKLSKRWVFDSDEPGNEGYAGQGNHSLSIADVDGDGKDEIVYGAMVVNNDGTGLYTTGLGHGDALHVGKFNPNRPGMEIFATQEWASAPYGFAVRDAATGEILAGEHTGTDVGRGMIADIDPRYDGAEFWASDSWDGSEGLSGLYSVEGELITNNAPKSLNFAIWWDGDLLRELLDHDFNAEDNPPGVGKIDKWNWEKEELETIFVPEGTRSNNWTKGNPALQADLFGDWREEVIWPSEDDTELRIYTTTDVTEHRIYTLMHDPQYRTAIAWQNVAYNQPPHPSFFIGHDMEEPPVPSIYVDKLETNVQVTPKTLNLKSNGKANSFNVIMDLADANVGVTDNVQLKVNDSTITATSVSEKNNSLQAKFDRQDIIQAMEGLNGNIDVEVTAYLADGTILYGSDTIKVIH
ncbi:family 16 glycoside hydrolase [Bacillus sp. JCM 19034]|uniref:rhamnogalacturonan lyase family protein n=1 Tax=Bacillus sp. JCM 19034 TaxID=1481928 RepID=UPI001E4BCFEB